MLGTLGSFAVQRYQFFGRETVSFLVVLPIALPGIVTGIALNAAFNQAGITLGFFTLVVAHATFCIVLVYNNVIARLRRLAPNLEEASADLGADPFQTFRYVTFPLVRSALLAGGLLAFALSASTRSSSRRSRPAPASRRCRSGSTTTCSARTTCRS